MAARTAAEVAYDAASAATAPDPRAASKPRSIPPVVQRPTAPAPTARAPGAQTGPSTPIAPSARIAPTGRISNAARAGARGLAPVKRASRILVLEVTSAMFALMALSFGLAAWGETHSVRALVDGYHRKALLFSIFTLVLLYFSLSGFFRAHRVARS